MTRLGLVAVGVAALSACGPRRPPERLWVQVPTVQVLTEGVVIEDASEEFRLVAGPAARTPFWSYDCPAAPTTENYALALELGARRVRVRHPASSAALHGVLAFCRVGPRAAAAVQRGYVIRIPDEYVHATSDGRVSFRGEPSGYSQLYADGEFDLPAWILWLSEREL